jgi:hypothetical protein
MNTKRPQPVPTKAHHLGLSRCCKAGLTGLLTGLPEQPNQQPNFRHGRFGYRTLATIGGGQAALGHPPADPSRLDA